MCARYKGLREPFEIYCEIEYHVPTLCILYDLNRSLANGGLGTVKYLRYIFQYVSALNRNLSGAEIFSDRYGSCCKQTALYHHSWETVLVGEVRFCCSYLSDQTECVSYQKGTIEFDAG